MYIFVTRKQMPIILDVELNMCLHSLHIRHYVAKQICRYESHNRYRSIICLSKMVMMLETTMLTYALKLAIRPFNGRSGTPLTIDTVRARQ